MPKVAHESFLRDLATPDELAFDLEIAIGEDGAEVGGDSGIDFDEMAWARCGNDLRASTDNLERWQVLGTARCGEMSLEILVAH